MNIIPSKEAFDRSRYDELEAQLETLEKCKQAMVDAILSGISEVRGLSQKLENQERLMDDIQLSLSPKALEDQISDAFFDAIDRIKTELDEMDDAIEAQNTRAERHAYLSNLV